MNHCPMIANTEVTVTVVTDWNNVVPHWPKLHCALQATLEKQNEDNLASLSPYHIPRKVGQPVDHRLDTTDELQVFSLADTFLNKENHKAGRNKGHGKDHTDGHEDIHRGGHPGLKKRKKANCWYARTGSFDIKWGNSRRAETISSAAVFILSLYSESSFILRISKGLPCKPLNCTAFLLPYSKGNLHSLLASQAQHHNLDTG